MSDHQEEYKSVFIAETEGHLEEIDRLLTLLEKEPGQTEYVHALFRITHTLKGNAESMAFTTLAEVSHALEDLFGVMRDEGAVLNADQFNSVYKASDLLGKALVALKTNAKVPHLGIRTRLKVIADQLRSTEEEPPKAKVPAAKTKATAKSKPVAKPATKEPIQPEAQVQDPEPSAEPALEGENSIIPTPEITEAEGPILSWSSKDLVQVPVYKLDDLLNLVGELVIERDRILATHAPTAGASEFSRLNRLASDLQYAVMDVRLVQVGFLFNKYHRTLRDAASLEHKNVRLVLDGTDTEIDRNVLQALSDSLTHLLRNAVAHGIESPEERQRLGKAKEGTIILSARSDNDAVLIEIRDDGGGIHVEKIREKAVSRGLISAEHAKLLKEDDLLMYIFEPGFSTQNQVNTLSGRGVGMDVVKRAVESVGGTIRISTEAKEGTTITLRVPASMAVKGTLLCQISDITYAIPLIYTDAVVSIYANEISTLNNRKVFRYSGEPVPLLFLKEYFGQRAEKGVNATCSHKAPELHPEQKLELVVVEAHGRKVAMVVDKLLQQKEIVEKPLSPPLQGNSSISGVTILGSGRVCPVLNVVSLTNAFFASSMIGNY